MKITVIRLNVAGCGQRQREKRHPPMKIVPRSYNLPVKDGSLRNKLRILAANKYLPGKR
jgi:hypothetical protein